MLYIAIEDGVYRWAGLLASQDYYAAPELEVIAPPPGLIYQQGDDWWQINDSGEAEHLLTYKGNLSLNPSGTLALYADMDDHQLTLFHLPEGETEIIEIAGALLHSSSRMPWLDDETAVLIVGSPDEEADVQGSTGNLATLNVLDGTLLTLPPQLSFYSYPFPTASDDILYNSEDGLRLWHDGREQRLDFSHSLVFEGTESTITSLYAPVMSPDGRYLVGILGGEYGRYTFAYILTDLTAQTSTFIHFFLPIPTDAALSWGIHWSPDSQWVALDPPSGDFFASSIQLVPVTNLSNRMALTGITSSPFWLDGWRLVFKSITKGQLRWRYLDRMTGEQFWLDLPNGAEVVHYASSN